MSTHPSAAPGTAQGSKLLPPPEVGVPLANMGRAAILGSYSGTLIKLH